MAMSFCSLAFHVSQRSTPTYPRPHLPTYKPTYIPEPYVPVRIDVLLTRISSPVRLPPLANVAKLSYATLS
ncbi:hypothetical protein BDV95DRAFT_576148 [Massariosphaeria phaeospora]|uniref:Uncharacterized protein n=1 Tax=Massariosphaeria phaeospora TaxID=100035 RepID=A0A7C8IB55_9PLEO|nr:hypothetical protein BDV95DRAFT_576148 [Massariosphaeria phaeospora]